MNPATTSGTQLAAILVNVFLAMLSGLSGNSRPANLQAGGIWVDTNSDSLTLWYVKLWDGVGDITICGIDRVNLTITLGETSGSLRAIKSSDDALGPDVELFKNRIAGTGQTQSGDSMGRLTYRGQTATDVEVITALIQAVATQNITDTVQGTDLLFMASVTGAAAATEAMRIKDAKLGIATSSPAERLHLLGNARLDYTAADAIAPQLLTTKARVASLGQVLSGDAIGQWSMYSTDDAGTRFESCRIVATATENHTATNRGTSFKVFTIANGSSTLVESFTITNGVVTTLPAGYYKNNLTAVTAPTTGDDSGDGYSVGSLWIDHTSDFLYYLKDATLGAAVWEILGGGGGWTMYATENISGGGTISSATNRSQQVRRVQGNGGAQSTSVTPFGTGGGWKDGTVIEVVGKSATNTLTIPFDSTSNDVAKGAMINGEAILGLNDRIALRYQNTEDRWYELYRNIRPV